MINILKILAFFLLLNRVLFAEFILTDGKDNPLDPKRLSFAQLNEVRSIYKDILLKYQWPMITMYFDEMSQKDKAEYISFLKENRGIEHYINYKISAKHNNAYKAVFVPSSYVELATMIVFARQTFERAPRKDAKGNNRSAFPDEDVRNSTFATEILHSSLRESIFKALDERDVSDKNLSYLKLAFEGSNLRNEVYNLYIDAAYYLTSQFSVQKPSRPDGVKAVIIELTKSFLELQDSFYSESKNKNLALFMQHKNTKAATLTNNDYDTLIKSSIVEYEAFMKNEFVLFRSIKPLDLDLKIIETPYRGLLEKNVKEFQPSTYSFGNSVLAGTFYESAASGGARALDYMRVTHFGYALVFPINDFLQNTKGKYLTLRDKYFVAPLCSVSALFSAGELFHSRSKISIVDEGKRLSQIHGTYEKSIGHILLLDAEKKADLLIERDTQWKLLAADITADIGTNSVFLHEKSLMESELRKKNQLLIAERIVQLQLAKPARDMTLPPKARSMLVYNKNNLFFPIMQDSNEAKTTVHIKAENFIAFDDIRKRTKEHVLIIPKGPYVSFPDFVAKASFDKISDIFKGIAATAKLKGLDKTGYRIISNIKGRAGNNANQEVMHLHFHMAGGECLGVPVVKASKSSALSNTMSIPSELPGGFMLSDKTYVDYVLHNAIFSHSYAPAQSKFIAYDIKNADKIPHLIGFMIINSQQQSAFKSIQDFAESADKEELVAFLQFISAVANNVGLDEAGYRIISNHGQDSLQLPSGVFQIFIAGGTRLGPTVSNFYGSDKDHEQILERPHWHCPTSVGHLHYFLSNYKSRKSLAKNFSEVKKVYLTVQSELRDLPDGIAKVLSKADRGSFFYRYANQLSDRVKEYISKLDTIVPFNAFLGGEKLLEPELLAQEQVLQEMKHFLEGSEIVVNDISAISPTIFSNKNNWIFLDLDNTFTKGFDSTDLNERELPLVLKEFQEAGGKVIGLTNRYYWDNMDRDSKGLLRSDGQPMYRDTFKLLNTIGFKFSNPGELKEFLMGYPGKHGENSYKIPKFKDGVIFCSEQNKGTCLIEYLHNLFNNKLELPTVVDFYDSDYRKIEEVRQALENHNIFGRLFHYEAIQ